MKKFEFTLQSLKKYNEQILDSEKSVLGRMRAELAELQGKLDSKLQEYEQARIKLDNLLKNGTDAVKLSVHKRYISSLQQDIYRLKAQINTKNEEIEIQLDVVIDATKEVTKLEKLEEKQIEEYKYAEQKETEQFIEEFVSNSGFYDK